MGNSFTLNPFAQQIKSHVVIEKKKNDLPVCGLYIINKEIRQQFAEADVALPLKNLTYNIQVVNHLAKVSLIQTFHNSSTMFLEAQYSFPIDPKVVVHQFRAKFGDVIISGLVKQKQQAKQQYKQGLAQGRQVAYGQINSDSYDIMNLMIGNIPPQTTATIEIELIQELEVEMNTFYKLRIPSTITPRYINDHKNADESWKDKIVKYLPSFQNQPTYTWNFNLKLLSNSPLTFNNSPSHDLLQTTINQTKTEADFILAQNQVPNKDFVFVYSNEVMMACTMGVNDASVSAAISFVPKYAQMKPTDAFLMMMKDQPLEVDIEKAAGEYIFVLDRSGSMAGGRINKALEALKLFIKSLPPKSLFNVISFGSRYQTMFQSSLEYNDENMRKALQILGGYTADLGGTEIQAPLTYIFNRKVSDGYPRQIFLLTDGDVSNTNKVIKLVGENTKYSRVHTIGIGSGCSAALIKGCAEKGKGKAVFITDGSEVASPIIELLEQSLTPIITSFSLDFDSSVVESIVPNPRQMPFILKNQPVNFYVIFKQGFTGSTAFTLKYTQSVHNIPYENQIVVDTEKNQLSFPFIDKIAHHKTISVLVDKYNSKKSLEEDILIAKVANLQMTIVSQSVKHQVLCPLTAFICVGKKLVDGKYVEFLQKGQSIVIVPQHQSADNQPGSPLLGFGSPPFANVACNRPILATTTACHGSPLASRSQWGMPSSTSNYSPSHSFDFFDSFSTLQCKAPPPPPACKPIRQMKSVQSQRQFVVQDMMEADIADLDFCEFKQCEQKQVSHAQHKKEKTKPMVSTLDYVISSQKSDGSWQATKELLESVFPAESQLKIFRSACESQQINPDLLITVIISNWLSAKHNTPAYSLIIKKAKTWTNKRVSEANVDPQQLSNLASTLAIA